MTWKADVTFGIVLGGLLTVGVIVGVNADVGISIAGGVTFWFAWIAMAVFLRRRRAHARGGDGWRPGP